MMQARMWQARRLQLVWFLLSWNCFFIIQSSYSDVSLLWLWLWYVAYSGISVNWLSVSKAWHASIAHLAYFSASLGYRFWQYREPECFKPPFFHQSFLELTDCLDVIGPYLIIAILMSYRITAASIKDDSMEYRYLGRLGSECLKASMTLVPRHSGKILRLCQMSGSRAAWSGFRFSRNSYKIFKASHQGFRKRDEEASSKANLFSSVSIRGYSNMMRRYSSINNGSLDMTYVPERIVWASFFPELPSLRRGSARTLFVMTAQGPGLPETVGKPLYSLW